VVVDAESAVNKAPEFAGTFFWGSPEMGVG